MSGAKKDGSQNAGPQGGHDVLRLLLERQKRAIRVLTRCSEILIRAVDETALLQEVCRIVVEDGGYRLAWVGYAEVDGGRVVKPVAQCGFEVGYLDTVSITWDETETGRGPTGTAIRTGKPTCVRNILDDPDYAPWREQAVKRGYASGLALPLIADSQTLGALNIYAAEADAFDPEEKGLLTRMADHLAYGIVTLRAREEQTRTLAELRSSREDWKRIFNSITDPVMILDLDQNILVANRAVENALGLTLDRVIGRKCYKLFHNIDETAEGCPYKALIETGGAVEIKEMEMEAVGGTFLVTVAPIFNDEGKLSRVLHIAKDITERRQAEDKLQESETLYKAIFEATGTATMIVDEDTTIIMANQESLRVTGYTRQELMGTKWTAYVTPESLEIMLKYHKARREDPSSAPSEYEVKLINKEGQVRDAILQVALVPGAGQSVVSILDITDSRRAEEQLRRVEERFRLAFNTSPDAININRLEDGLYIDINEGFTAITGYTREDAIGKTSLELNIWDDPADRDRLVAGLRQDGQVNNLEAGFRMKDGRVVTALLSAKIITLDDVPCILSITRDIEDIKQAETALRVSETKFRAIFEGSRDAIGVSKAGLHVIVNPAYLKLYGYENESEIVGTSILNLIAPGERDNVMAKVRKRAEGDRVPYFYETRGLRKDGTEFDMEVSVSTYDLDTDSYTLVTLRDIGEKKILEVNLRQAQKMESVGRLAGGVAHDFNNYLTAVQGYIDLVLLDLPESSVDERVNLMEARQSAERATNLTRQLLLFSRRETAELRTVNLNKIVSDLSTMLQRLIGEQYSLISKLEDDLPPVQADTGQIEQVLMNLVVNARDAMADGGEVEIRTAEVEVDETYVLSHMGSRTGRFIRLFVRDTGSGMDEETVAHIFEPFFSTKQTGHGTGLGLSMVYGIITQHGGWIDVDSGPESGTTFSVFLPVVSGESIVEDVSTTAGQGLLGHGERILLVEDNDAVRKFAESMLTGNNYNVVSAASAEEALDIFEAESGEFHMVFSDVILPGMNGVKLVEQLARRKPGLRIMLASGFMEGLDLQTIHDQGYRFLEKPYSLTDLLRQVKELLAK